MKSEPKCRTIITIISVLLIASLGFGGDSGYWQQQVRYRMNVSLNPEEHLLSGESAIVYVNNSPDTLDRIYMHLYPNAFQEGSVKHREFQRVHYTGGISKDNPSYIEVREFTITSSDGNSSSEFRVDDTILSAPLASLLVPGDSLTIALKWEHKVRERSGRAGYLGEQYDFAQWYPKMVVYDAEGWHNVPFHAIGEFYGEFGTFDVTVDVPARYIVGATGTVVDGDPGWAEVTVDTTLPFSEWVAALERAETDSAARRVVTFHAKDVHDFAWITSPTFVYEHGQWGDIDIHVLYNISVGEDWTKVVRARSERAVEWLSTKFGTYPYPQVTVTHAMRGGGMEYPMLVMNGSEREGLIVHEVGHIWFYGILGNNEVDEAWLDEGFTTFQTRWYLENRYPPYGIDFESSSRYGEFQRKHWSFTSISDRDQWSAIDFMISFYNDPIAGKSYLASGYPAYRQNAYIKPSLMLQCLQSVLGDSVFDRAMKIYYRRWQLKHPDELRFRNVIEEVSGQDMDWFFDSWLHKTSYLDYALKKWTKRRLENGKYEVTATIVNKADMQSPLDVEVVLANGERFRARWANHLWRWEDDFVFAVPGRPKRIILDPDNRTLDVNLLNNVSGLAPHRFRFNWPGMDYRPRDSYVVKWNPVLWYHERDGIKPGVTLVRTYSRFSRLGLSMTAGMESEKVFGQIDFAKSLWFMLPSLRFSARGYYLEGVRGGSADLTLYWSRYYGYPPRHEIKTGFYVADAFDTSYTDLYEPGRTVVWYGKYGFSANIGDYGGNLSLAISSSPGGLSDWSFARFVSQFELHGRLGSFGLAVRFINGLMSSDNGGVPAQERFTVYGAGSGDYFSKPYLRHPSSVYNLKIEGDFLRNRFHLYGDANLRGYYAHGFSGAENVVAGTFEATRSLPVSEVEIKGRAFFDGGWLWSETDDLRGDLLADSGLGLSVGKRLLGASLRFRIDFPFWLNHTTGAGGKEVKSISFSRWVIGLDTGL